MSKKYFGSIRLPVNRFHMELTNICNFSCEFCPESLMKRPSGMMSPDMAKSLLDEIAEYQIARVVHFHLMGEPILYSELVDIISYASHLGIETSVTTNGSLLDDEVLSALIDSNLDSLIISLQTPDEKTFSLRCCQGITFQRYSHNVINAARRFLSNHNTGRTTLTVSFLSTPLRWFSILGLPDVSIADTSKELRKYLRQWLIKIIDHPDKMKNFQTIIRDIGKVQVFKENTIIISEKLSFLTRILGDWAADINKRKAKALFGYCPAIQDNFGILCNGDYVYCCTDYDGYTSKANAQELSIIEYLNLPVVQKTLNGFNRFRVHEPYCQQCLGDRHFLNALVKQIGSIIYFKASRNIKRRQE